MLRCLANVPLGLAVLLLAAVHGHAQDDPKAVDPQDVLDGLQDFYRRTARADGSFQPGIDPEYLGISDTAYSDLAAVTYACTISKTFGWELPHEKKTIEFLQSRQRPTGEFVNVGGTVDPASPQGKTYNTTQALVALRALGAKPRFDPLPVFEEILKQDYKTLPAYSTSFFPLAYLAYGRPIPAQADRAIRALMVQDDEGYLNDHIAATYHASHYYALVGEPTPKAEQMLARVLRDQNQDGSWLINAPARDRHATFDAVFTLRHEGGQRPDCRRAIERAADWALRCRNSDGGFGHYPGSTSDADAVYFQVGTLVMTGRLEAREPLPPDAHLLSWGHAMPLRQKGTAVRLALSGWVGGVAFHPEGRRLATGSSDGAVQLWDTATGKRLATFKGHENAVSSAVFSRDGARLVTGSHDHTARVWDVEGQIHKLTGHAGAVLSIAIAPDKSFVATGSIDGTIRIWNGDSGNHIGTLQGHKSWVNSIALSPRGDWLASGSSDGTVKIWSMAKRELIQSIAATDAEVRSIAISPDGEWLAAGIRYGETQLWNTKTWEQKHRWKQPGDDVWAVAFTPDSAQVVSAPGEWNRPGEIVFWDVASGEQRGRLTHTGEVLSLAISADGKGIAAGGGDKAVSIWTLPEATRDAPKPEK